MTNPSSPISHPGPAAQKAALSRAGRNLPQAISVAVALGALVLASVMFIPRLWIAVVAAAVALATWEVFKRLRQAGIRIPLIPLVVGGQLIVWASWPWKEVGAFTAFAATVVVVFIWRLFLDGRNNIPRNYLRDTGVSVFMLSWIALLGACGAMIAHGPQGGRQVVVLILAVAANDIGGYVAGVFFGKHPMVPAISPKKSWEGFAGSMVFGVMVGALSFWLLLGASAPTGALFGLLVALTATLGDLVESQVKRDLGIKDMGTLLPGHGGLMDRIDSLLPAAVVAYLVFRHLL